MAVETFGQWLKRRRGGLGLTQVALAASIGYAAETLQKVEADKLRPSKQLAAKLAAALELRPEQYPAFIRFARDEGELPDLPTQTAALHPASPATRAAHHHNLPVPLTAFIGREREAATVANQLRQPDVRLLTLTGPGGIGKTRLALQVATSLLDAFPDGVWFVDLAPIQNPLLVASTIATTLRLQESPVQTLVDSLRAYLHDKQVLLLLDNFEQILAAGALVAELLAAAPQLKVLVTSRVVLGVYGEYDLPVPPLALPDPHHPPPLEQLIANEAVQLFQARAQAAAGGFVVGATNAPLVAELCQRLDGLPLAIELAAARLRHLPLATVLARVSSRLTLLTAGPRTVPQRQQTIRATIDWSYQLLDEDEQTLFARLSVFVGGWTLAAAEAVCNADGELPLDVLDGLAALLDKSLIKQIEGLDGEPRFTMLETIREYALEQLERSGETHDLRQRHLAYFLALAEAAEPVIVRQRVWAERLGRDHDNLRAALAWGLAPHGEAELGLRLAGALALFWRVRGYHSEAGIWLEGALERGRRATVPPAAAVRAKVLLMMGGPGYQRDAAGARLLLEESLALYRAAGDQAGMAAALVHLGRVARDQGDAQRAQQLEEEGLARCQAEGDAHGTVMALLGLGDVALDQGDTVRATARCQEALAVCRAEGDRYHSRWAQVILGRIAYAEGEYARALTWLAEPLALFRELEQPAGVAEVLLELGRVAQAQGDESAAATHYVESLALCRELGLGHVRDVAYCLEGLGGAAGRGPGARGARLLGAAAALRESKGIPLPPVNRGDYERHVTAARAQLDEATFAAAWAEGRALTMEQAIAEAERLRADLETAALQPEPTHTGE